MFEEFYSLKHTPFERDIPVESLYNSHILDEVVSRLELVAERQQFAIVLGDCGTGKTTAIRKLAKVLNPSMYKMLYISDSKMTPRNFYNTLLEQFGSIPHHYRSDAKRQLHKEVELLRAAHNIKLVVVCDECHLYNKEMLEEVRFTLNYKYDSVSPMALILVGQSELMEILKRQAYTAIRQRVDIKCELMYYDRSQTAEYMDCHMRYAGAVAPVFSDLAIDAIYDYSSGSARMINKLCTACLNFGSQSRKKIIDDHMVKEIIAQEML